MNKTWLLVGGVLMALSTAPGVWAQTPDSVADEGVETTVTAAGEAAAEATALEGAGDQAMVAADAEGDAAAASAPVVEDTSANPNLLPHDLTPWGMYQQADVIVKAVMILLLLASIATWGVWLFKLVQLRLARRRVRKTLNELVASASFLEARDRVRDDRGAAGDMIAATAHELKLSAQGPASEEGIKERVSARLDRVLIAAGGHMNKGTSVLATIGAVAPFVGLFGTVWGIMNSFIGIAKTQTTNLAVVAPGIAEALLATAIGLVAAIPAVVIYNHFARVIGYYRTELGDVGTALLTLVSRDLDRHSPQARVMGAAPKQA